MLKKIIRRTQYFINELRYPGAVKIDYAVKRNNFGDILNPVVVEHFIKRKTTRVAAAYTNKEHLLGIGSILNRANRHSVVWGSGFIKENSLTTEIPLKVLSVRGPKTRERLLELNIECPEIYGDPALLMPGIYNPHIKKKYKLGIIPHYVDYNDSRLKKIKDDDVIVIDICNPNPLKVIDQLLECEHVASSSLHGLIVSDAYNIPNVWIKLSDSITGGDFKFLDYFGSIDRETIEPLKPNKEISKNLLIDSCQRYVVTIDSELLINELKSYYCKWKK